MNHRPSVQPATSTSDAASSPDGSAVSRAFPWTLIRRAWIRSSRARSGNAVTTGRGGDVEVVVDSERRAA